MRKRERGDQKREASGGKGRVNRSRFEGKPEDWKVRRTRKRGKRYQKRELLKERRDRKRE